MNKENLYSHNTMYLTYGEVKTMFDMYEEKTHLYFHVCLIQILEFHDTK